MKKQTIYPVIFIFFLNITFAYTQQPTKQSDRRALIKYESAVKEVARNNYLLALSFLNGALEIDQNYLDALLMVAHIDFLQKKYKSSVEKYKDLYKKNPNLEPYYRSEYAIALGGDGYFEEALVQLNLFLTQPNLDTQVITKIEQYKKNFEFAISYAKQNIHIWSKYKFTPQNLGYSINSKYSEYFPTLTFDAKKIIFTRRVNHQNEDFYEAEVEDSTWTVATPIKGLVNTPLNEGTQSVSLDERWLAFTGCNFPDGYGSCDIYFSNKTNYGWAKPYNIGSRINTEFWESQPAFSPDKRYLYFAAKLPDGYGGSDLYYSYLDDEGRWSEPLNLGPNINTPGNEISPFIHSDNETLYFTSNGWQGYGEMDIFMSRRNPKGQWQTPVNLGYPINTIENESCLFINSEGKEAFYSSDRADSKGGLDIYKFKIRDDIRPKETYWVKLQIKDRESRRNLPASLDILDMEYNAITLRPLLLEDTSYLVPFIAGKKYFISAQHKGYLYNYYIAQRPINDTPLVNTRTIIISRFDSTSKMILKNIYFDIDDYTLKPNSIPELNVLLQFLRINNNIQIKLEGHTDNTGDETHNIQLSFQRADAVRNFLQHKGIPAERLTIQGFGSSQPIVPNTTEKGKQLNRRTEMKIIQ